MAHPIQGNNPWVPIAAGAQAVLGIAGENYDITNNSAGQIEYRISLLGLAGRVEIVVKNALGRTLTLPLSSEGDRVHHHFIVCPPEGYGLVVDCGHFLFVFAL